MVNIMTVVRLCFDANRAIQLHNGEENTPDWFDAPQEAIDSTLNGVRMGLTDDFSPEELHANWMHDKIEAGWVHGEKKDFEAKTHPQLLPYDELPAEQRLKDEVFRSIVGVFRELGVVDDEV